MRTCQSITGVLSKKHWVNHRSLKSSESISEWVLRFMSNWRRRFRLYQLSFQRVTIRNVIQSSDCSMCLKPQKYHSRTQEAPSGSPMMRPRYGCNVKDLMTYIEMAEQLAHCLMRRAWWLEVDELSVVRKHQILGVLVLQVCRKTWITLYLSIVVQRHSISIAYMTS